jgi:hypothetical protein
MKKNLLFSGKNIITKLALAMLLAFSFPSFLFSQVASDNCSDAPMICNVNGYTGNTSSSYHPDCTTCPSSGGDYSNMVENSTMFDGIINNNSWITFTAVASLATLQFDVTNCSVGDGVQFGIYSGTYTGTDCDNFVLLTDIAYTSGAGAIGPGSYQITASPLTVGNTYFIMVDGWAGDVCDYMITVIDGVATGSISGSATVCSGQTGVTYTMNSVATGFNWGVPAGATYIQSGNTITVDWGTATSGDVTCTTTAGVCTGIVANFPVTVIASPIASAGNDGPVCEGGVLNLTSLPAGMTSYAWAGPNGFSSSSQDASITNVTPAATGTYTVTVTNVSCTSTATTDVTINPNPVAPVSATADHTTFCVGDYANIILTATGGSGTTLNWYSGSCGGTFLGSGNDLSIPAPVDTTTYYASWTNVCGTSSCASFTVTVNPWAVAPTSASVDNAAFCVGDYPTITLTATGGGGTVLNWYAGSCGGTLVGTGSPLTIPAPVTTTSYFSSWATPCGASTCQSVTVTIASTATPPTSASVDNNNFCDGDFANITLTAAGGVGTTLNWYSGMCGGTPVGTGTPLIIPAPADTTSYYAAWADACGASSCANITVIVNPLPIAPTSASVDTNNFCDGGIANITLTAAGGNGTTLNWYTSCGGAIIGSGTPLIIPAPTDTTTYYAAWTNGCGTSSCANVTVIVNPLPTVFDFSGGGSFCAGGNGVPINLSGSEIGVDYQLQLGGVDVGTPIAGTGSAIIDTLYNAGTYTVIATNTATSCQIAMNGSVTVIVNPLPVATASNNGPICQGDTLDLAGGDPGMASYSWSGPNGFSDLTQNPNVSDSVTAAMAGTYTLTISDGTCTNTATTVVIVNALPLIVATSNGPVCEGDTLTLTGGTNGMVSYNWTGPNGYSSNWESPTVSDSATQAMAGVYIHTISDGTCTNTASTTVVINPLPIADAGTDDTICAGSAATLAGVVGGGATNGTWSGGTGTFAPDATTLNAAYTPSTAEVTAGTATLILTTDDPSGCGADTDTMTITINPLPTADAGTDQAICAGSTATLSGSVGGGATMGTWSGGTGTYSPDATTLNAVYTPSAAEVTAGTATLTLTTNDPASCGTDIDNITITINPLPTADAGTDQAICAGSTATLAGSVGGGATMGTWSGGTGTYLPDATTLNAVYTPSAAEVNAGTAILIMTSNDPLSCGADIDSITITINPLPNADAGPDTNICNGSSVILSASGGTGFLWSPSTGLSDTTIYNPAAFPSVTTTYVVLVTDANGCTNTDDITVTVIPYIVVNAGADDTICLGDTTTLNASGGVVYSWSPSAGLSADDISNPLASPAVTTNYTVTIINAIGCSGTDEVIISVNPTPNANAGADVNVCEGNSTQLNASGGVSYIWSPSTNLSSTTIADPIADPVITTTYSLTVTDANGCSATDDVVVSLTAFPVISVDNNLGVDYLYPGQLVTFIASPSGLDNYEFYLDTTLVQSGNSNEYTTSSLVDASTISVVGAENGCPSEIDTLIIDVKPFPNAFTPFDVDGVNDIFLKGLDLTVLNRWGQIIYQGTEGWNGKSDGVDVNSGTYYYIVKLKDVNNVITEVRGVITVVKE